MFAVRVCLALWGPYTSTVRATAKRKLRFSKALAPIGALTAVERSGKATDFQRVRAVRRPPTRGEGPRVPARGPGAARCGEAGRPRGGPRPPRPPPRPAGAGG